MQEHLIQLHRKLEFAERSDMARESAALRDVAPELDKLRIKALFKAREFLIARCSSSGKLSHTMALHSGAVPWGPELKCAPLSCTRHAARLACMWFQA